MSTCPACLVLGPKASPAFHRSLAPVGTAVLAQTDMMSQALLCNWNSRSNPHSCAIVGGEQDNTELDTKVVPARPLQQRPCVGTAALQWLRENDFG